MRLQQAAALGEIGVEVLVPDRLDHLDRHQLVVAAAQIAVVARRQRRCCRRARPDSRAREQGVLLLRDRGGGDVAAVALRGVQREAAPAGADLEHVVAGLQVELAADAVELAPAALRASDMSGRVEDALTSTSSSGRETSERTRCRGRSARRCSCAAAAARVAAERVQQLAQRRGQSRVDRLRASRARRGCGPADATSATSCRCAPVALHVRFARADRAAEREIAVEARVMNVHDDWLCAALHWRRRSDADRAPSTSTSCATPATGSACRALRAERASRASCAAQLTVASGIRRGGRLAFVMRSSADENGTECVSATAAAPASGSRRPPCGHAAGKRSARSRASGR